MSESKFKFPTEEVELPSKGLLYPEGHPLKSGKIEMKYMTAKEEDILTNQNYIAKGIVLDKLLPQIRFDQGSNGVIAVPLYPLPSSCSFRPRFTVSRARGCHTLHSSSFSQGLVGSE